MRRQIANPIASHATIVEPTGVPNKMAIRRPTTAQMTEKIAAKYDKKVFCHDRVPNGDGGISTGQAAIALHRL
jgi:hydrogenase maturation factor HypF (carbamoyltransferase family)